MLREFFFADAHHGLYRWCFRPRLEIEIQRGALGASVFPNAPRLYGWGVVSLAWEFDFWRAR